MGGASHPRKYPPTFVKHLAEQASERLGTTIEKVVITVPAYFDDAQRRATIRAGELAGLEVVRIVNEPTAAALVYDHVPSEIGSESPYVLVYDLGGGTFDVSVLEIKGEIKEVLASSGDTSLGGDDFDERLKDHLLEELRRQAGRAGSRGRYRPEGPAAGHCRTGQDRPVGSPLRQSP